MATGGNCLTENLQAPEARVLQGPLLEIEVSEAYNSEVKGIGPSCLICTLSQLLGEVNSFLSMDCGSSG